MLRRCLPCTIQPWENVVVDSAFWYCEVIATQRRIMSNFKKGGQSSLFDVLARFKHTSSSDPRDKVYGLLGMVSDTLGVEAGYTKSVKETYTGVTIALINASGNLESWTSSAKALGDVKASMSTKGRTGNTCRPGFLISATEVN